MGLPLRWLVLAEAAMGLATLIWLRFSETALPYALTARAVSLALGLTLVFTLCNYGLFRVSTRFAFTRPVQAFFEEEIFPLVRQASFLDIVLASAAAGFAEELLFRGMLMPRMGLVASSLLFGFLHGPEYKLWPMALWASIVGLGFGVLYEETSNLVVPMIVHGVYDALALAYIRLTPAKTGA
jgi:membrane protease YdiL (CAAX protease family)